MKKLRYSLQFTVPLLISLQGSAQSIKEFSIVKKSAGKISKVSIWELKHKNTKVGALLSIGGDPFLKQLVPLKAESSKLFRLDYDAGIMGTKVLSHIERSVILEMRDSGVIKHIDYLSRVERSHKGKIHSQENRSFSWEKDILILGEIEAESSKRYRWTGSSFALVE